MPPLKNIDRGIDGELLKALEGSGHGQRLAIVDPSYPIPKDAWVLNYHGHSSALALEGILRLVSTEGDVVIMGPDEGDGNDTSGRAFKKSADTLGIQLVPIGRYNGFYAEANDPEAHTMFVRTRDEKAYACAMFIIGHAQS